MNTTKVTKIGIIAAIITAIITAITTAIINMFVPEIKCLIGLTDDLCPQPPAIQNYTIDNQNYKITAIAISNDGTIIANGNNNGAINVWNTENNTKIQDYQDDREISAIAIKKDSSTQDPTIFSANKSGDLKSWNPDEKNNVVFSSNKLESITSLVLSDDGKILAGAGKNNFIYILNLSKKIERKLEVNKGVESLAINNNGQILVSGHYKNAIYLWDLNEKDPKPQNLLQESESWDSNFVSVSSDGKKIVSSNCKQEIKIWNFKQSNVKSLNINANICLVGISSNGKILTGRSEDGTITVWKLGKSERLKKIYFFPNLIPTSDLENYRSIVISKDGKTIATHFLNTIKVWQLPNINN